MNVNYQLLDNAETGEITLRIASIDPGFYAKILQETGLHYQADNSAYVVNIYRSGTNSLESNMGSTILYVAEDLSPENGVIPFEQEIVLSGYVTADRNIYQDRVNNVMQMVNAAA